MQSQAELEEFLYIISHDFNAPLRHIREFTNLLVAKLDDGRLQEREKLYVDYIQDSVKEAEEMLSVLLKYSRLNTTPIEFTEFNLKKLTEETLNNYKDKIETLKALIQIKCDDDIKITADKNQIKILINELIDNALKFNSSERNPEININVKRQDGNIVFSISDNGIGGISHNLKDEVFKFFRKLNAKEEYKGAGMGLTMCRKITELHKGKIWVEASDKGGSCISFSILAQN